MKNERALEEEQRKMRMLRILIDLATATLYQGNLTMNEAIHLVSNTRKAVLNLFPGKEKTYDLIYRPRFERILKERMNRN